MAKQNEDLVKLVAKLIELTQDSILNWKIVKPVDSLKKGFSKIVGSVFESTYENKVLRIYKVEYDNTEENHMLNAYFYQPSYSTNINLEFVDKFGQSIWSFPSVTGIADLYDTIAYKAAGVDDFINNVLNSNDTTSNN